MSTFRGFLIGLLAAYAIYELGPAIVWDIQQMIVRFRKSKAVWKGEE